MHNISRRIVAILSLSGIATTLARSELAFSDADTDTENSVQNEPSENEATIIEYNEEIQDELLLNELKKKADSTFGQQNNTLNSYSFGAIP